MFSFCFEKRTVGIILRLFSDIRSVKFEKSDNKQTQTLRFLSKFESKVKMTVEENPEVEELDFCDDLIEEYESEKKFIKICYFHYGFVITVKIIAPVSSLGRIKDILNEHDLLTSTGNIITFARKPISYVDSFRITDSRLISKKSVCLSVKINDRTENLARNIIQYIPYSCFSGDFHVIRNVLTITSFLPFELFGKLEIYTLSIPDLRKLFFVLIDIGELNSQKIHKIRTTYSEYVLVKTLT